MVRTRKGSFNNLHGGLILGNLGESSILSSIWSKARKNTPGFDCGLCGYTTCTALVRAALAGYASVDRCPMFELDEYRGLRKALGEIIAEWVPGEVLAPEGLEEGIVLSKPCSDASHLLMADLQIQNGVEPGHPLRFNVLDPTVMCYLFECITRETKDFKCSTTLSYAWGDFEDIKLHVLKDGRIRMRRAAGKAHALKVFAKLERMAIGAVICDCCGYDFLSILAGFAPDDVGKHTVYKAGSSFQIENGPKPDYADKVLQDARSQLLGVRQMLKDMKQPSEMQVLLCDVLSRISQSAKPELSIGELETLAAVYFFEDGLRAAKLLQELVEENESLSAIHDEMLTSVQAGAFDNTELLSASHDRLVLLAYVNRLNRAWQAIERVLNR